MESGNSHTLRIAEEKRVHREKLWLKTAGRRYAECTLDGFRIYHPAQPPALELVRLYVSDLPDRVAKGQSLVLFGPKGTGKDHLAASVARVAALSGMSVRRTNGPELQGQNRDAFSNRDTSEEEIVDRLSTPNFLWLSDPVVPGAKLTEHQMGVLYRILEARYVACLPTLMTVNAEHRKDAETRIGPSIVDRVTHGATSVFCDWPSFRTEVAQ